jgi:hypothetical protein
MSDHKYTRNGNIEWGGGGGGGLKNAYKIIVVLWFMAKIVASKLIVWNVIFQIYAFENWNLAYPTPGKQPYFLGLVRSTHEQ